jgi:hypothetical protein
MSKLGCTFAGLYILIGGYLILTQGLFGESFIALILGLPWVLIPSYFEFFGFENNIAMMVFTLLPMAINVLVLYWIGAILGRLFTRKDGTM